MEVLVPVAHGVEAKGFSDTDRVSLVQLYHGNLHLRSSGIRLVIEAVKYRHNGVVVAQRAHSSLVQRLPNVMGSCEMEDLIMELVRYIEHDLSEKPVILLVERRVCEIRTDIGADTKWHEVALLIDIEEGGDRSTIFVVEL